MDPSCLIIIITWYKKKIIIIIIIIIIINLAGMAWQVRCTEPVSRLFAQNVTELASLTAD